MSNLDLHGNEGKHTDKDRISICCFPKSGSTYITKSLCNYTSYPQVVTVRSAEVQELSFQRFQKAEKFSCYITQSHFLPTKHALNLLDKFQLKTVFLYRNVLDCIVSLRDMYTERVTTNEGVWANGFTSQWGHYEQSFLRLDLSNQHDFIIESALNWYLTFFAGWYKKIFVENFEATVLKYESFFLDPDKNFQKLINQLNLNTNLNPDDFLLPKKQPGAAGTRFNVGRVGRGAEILTTDQKGRIEKAALIIEKGTGADLSLILDY